MISLILRVLAVVLFVLLAFTVFHGESALRAWAFAFAAFAASFLPFDDYARRN